VPRTAAAYRPAAEVPAASLPASHAMDIKLHRPQSVCSQSGRGFAAGDPLVSALVKREGGGLDRLDVAAEAWESPPAGTIAWWRSRYPAAGQVGPSLAPVDVLLDALEALEGDPTAEPLRYLLALQLVRRRVLRIDDQPAGDRADDGGLTLACRRRDCQYRVPAVAAAAAADPEVAARLQALLWSGEAA
jgi:hypothetical protein